MGGNPVHMGTLIRDKITTEWRRKFSETMSLFAHGNLISTKLYSVVGENLQTVKLTECRSERSDLKIDRGNDDANLRWEVENSRRLESLGAHGHLIGYKVQ